MLAVGSSGAAQPVTGGGAMAVETLAPAVSGAVRQVGEDTVGAGHTAVTAGAIRDRDGPGHLDVEVMVAARHVVDSVEVAVMRQVADSAAVEWVTVIMGAAQCIADAGHLVATARQAEVTASAARVSGDLLIVDLVVGGKADPPVASASGAALVSGEAAGEVALPTAASADLAAAIADRVSAALEAGGSSAVGRARMAAKTAATAPIGAVLVGGAAIEGKQAIAVPPIAVPMTGRLPVVVVDSPASVVAIATALGSAASIGALAVSAAAAPLGPASRVKRAIPRAAKSRPIREARPASETMKNEIAAVKVASRTARAPTEVAQIAVDQIAAARIAVIGISRVLLALGSVAVDRATIAASATAAGPILITAMANKLVVVNCLPLVFIGGAFLRAANFLAGATEPFSLPRNPIGFLDSNRR